jgi:hypothetical protein
VGFSGEEALIRQRVRPFIVSLYEDSRLRAQLKDAQAELLLGWGAEQLQATAARTVKLPEEDARPQLEKDATAVQLIITGVNDLLRRLEAPLDFDVIDDTLTRLLKNLHWLTETPLHGDQRRYLRGFHNARKSKDRELAFLNLFYLIRGDRTDSPTGKNH